MTRHSTLVVAAALLAAACAPQGPAATPAPLTSPPPPLPARDIQFPAYTEATLPNGLRLVVVENRSLPLAQVSLYVRPGSSGDPAGREGLASLTAGLLDKGTRTRSALEIAETAAGIGATLSVGAGQDVAAATINSLSDQLDVAFELLSDVTLRPSFPEREVETLRMRQLSSLRSAMGQAGYLAGTAFSRLVYGEAHPYASTSSLTSLAAITREDVTAYHAAHFVPVNALLVVSGDITPERARALAERHFGDWRGAPASRPALPPARGADQLRIHLVNRPASVQSSIYVGNPGLTPDNPDYYAVQVLNMVLGASSEGRLERVLRSQHGWTYSARSTFTRPAGVGVFRATTEVRTAVTDSALSELMVQLRRIREEPPSEAEVAAAKGYLVSSFPSRMETPGSVAGQLADAILMGLPASRVAEYPAGILAVTPQDIQRVARTYLHPDRMVVVVVGNAPEILPGLERIAPVEVHDVEGNRLDRASLGV